MRLIDADKLKNHYSWWKGGTGTMTYDEAKKTFDTIIDLQPTADIVEPKHGMTKGKYARLVGLHTHSPAFDKDAPLDAEFVKTVEEVRRIAEFTLKGEPKHGRWKGAGMGDYYCSLCNEVVTGNRMRYCPNCGSRMDEVK